MRLARLLPAVLAGSALFVLLQLALLVVAGVYRVQAAPPAGPLADRTTGVITVQHTVSTTHQMVVFGNGRITNWYLNDNGRNQIDQDGHNSNATTIAILFDQHPRPHDIDVGSDNDFYTTTLITLNDPSIIPGYSEDSYVVYASKALSYQVTQRTLTTDTVYNDWQVAEFRICNTGDVPLTGGKLLFMVDVDVAYADIGDQGGYESGRHLVYQTDENENVGYAMGISLLRGGWRGYGIDGQDFPDIDVKKIDEMTNPGNTVRDGKNDVSWVVANIPTLLTGQQTELSFGLCAKTGQDERDALIQLIDCISGTRRLPPTPPAIKIVKDGPATAKVGDSVVYTFTVSHADPCGGSPISGVTVGDDVAGPISYVSGDTNGNNKLDAGESWVYTATYIIQPTDPDPLENTATVEGEDQYGTPVTANDTHSIDIEFNPVLDIVKDGPHTANVSDTVVYTFTISHADTSDGSPVSDITVSDDIAGPGNYVRGDTNINHELDAGENWVYTATYTIQPTDSDPLTNTATVEGMDLDSNAVTAKDGHRTRIGSPSALQIVKDGPATAKVGDTVVYTFTVSHADASNGSPITNITVTDDVAGSAHCVSGDDGDGLLEVNEAWICTASYTIRPTDGDPLVNTGKVEGLDLDGYTISATATHATNLLPMLTVLREGPDIANINDIVTFTFTVSHAPLSDGSPVSNVKVNDDIGGQATRIDGDDDGDDRLDTDEDWIYTVSFTIPSGTVGDLQNRVTVTGEDPDGNEIVAAVPYTIRIRRSTYLPIILKNCLPPPICTTKLVDDFSNSGSGWIIGSFDDNTVIYSYVPMPSPQEYSIESKQDRNGRSMSPLGSFSQYTVKVNARWADESLGAWYGIIFGINGETDQRVSAITSGGHLYRFIIDTRGNSPKFNLQIFDGDVNPPGWRDVDRGWIEDRSINKGTLSNTLEAWCYGSYAAVYANQNLLWADNLGVTCSGKVGITSRFDPSQSSTNARFDNFEVCGQQSSGASVSESIGEEVPIPGD
jgi:hypothetical protein